MFCVGVFPTFFYVPLTAGIERRVRIYIVAHNKNYLDTILANLRNTSLIGGTHP